MARNAFKSFCKVFSLNNQAVSSITLTNTQGSAILCNYIQVDSRAIGGNDLGWYHIFPNDVYRVNFAASSTSSAGTTAAAGGAIGIADGSIEYLTPNKIGVSSITLYNEIGDVGTFVLRYGILTSSSELLDSDLLRRNGTKES